MKRRRVVMCKNTWPEADQEDFIVTFTLQGESDECACRRAAALYSDGDTFYMKTIYYQDEEAA
jgi:hypothetical protein